MSGTQRLIITVTLIVVFWELSAALVCYDCLLCNTPSGNKTCADNSKTCYTKHAVVFGRNVTWRGCSTDGNKTCDTSMNYLGYDGVKECRCAGDLCNNEEYSNAHVSSAISVFTLLALLGVVSIFN